MINVLEQAEGRRHSDLFSRAERTKRGAGGGGRTRRDMSERESVFKCIYEDCEECACECRYVILVCLVNFGHVLSVRQQPTTENRETEGDTVRRELTQVKAKFQTYCTQWEYVDLVTLRLLSGQK